jgi:predicted DNA-binding protein (MmcQ/YjbR family)
MLKTRAAFEKFVFGLPATTLHEQWGSLVAKVGGKVFALRGELEGTSGITFKVSEMTFDMLTEQPGIMQAPYFAKRHWIWAEADALGKDDFVVYVTESHRLIASKLTRKLLAELGLEATVAARPEPR